MSLTEIPNGWCYSVPPEDRVYQPPVPPEPFEPPAVTATAINGLVGGTVVEQAHAAFTHAKASFEKFLNEIPREHYSEEGFRESIKKFADTDAAKAVDTAVANVRDRAGKAAAVVENIRRDLSPAGDTAAELRATRSAGTGTQRLLDSAKDGNVFGGRTEADRQRRPRTARRLGAGIAGLPRIKGSHLRLDRHCHRPDSPRILEGHKPTEESTAGGGPR